LSRLQSQASFSSQVSSSDITPSPVGSVQDLSAQMNHSRKIPFFFKEENTGLIVKGNFMTLAAKPEHIDKAEWLAHQGKCGSDWRIFRTSLNYRQLSNNIAF
jgi:hypothetical protein